MTEDRADALHRMTNLTGQEVTSIVARLADPELAHIDVAGPHTVTSIVAVLDALADAPLTNAELNAELRSLTDPGELEAYFSTLDLSFVTTDPDDHLHATPEEQPRHG